MKPNIGFVFLCAMAFTSCTSGITGTYLDNQGDFLPVNDSLRQLEQKGYVHIQTAHDGNPLIQTVMLTYEPTFSQKVSIAKHDGTLQIAVILFLIALCVIAYGVYYGNNAGKWTGLPVVLFLTAIALVGAAAATINWAHTKGIPVTKQSYDTMQADGSFDQWVESNAGL